MYRRILFAFDGDEGRAEQAYPHLLALARSAQAEVVLCHVIASSGAIEAPAAADGTPLATSVRSNEQLDALHARLTSDGLEHVRTLILQGRPAEAIVTAAAAEHCDVMVLVTAGRRGLTRFFAGSVADAVVSDSRGIAVLLLRAEST